MKKAFYILIASAFLASCDVTDPIYDSVHPNTCELTLATDWSNCPSTPANYTAVLGSYSETCTGTTTKYPHLLDPGSYTIYAYNTADKITVSGTAATVATAAAGFVDPLPGLLYYGAKEFSAEKGKDQTVTVVMNQQVREVTFTIHPTGDATDKIETITAILEGVAQSIDLKTGVPTGAAASVNLTFAKQQSGDWTATVHLLGIVTSAKQTITLNVTFQYGSSTLIESALTEKMAGFNNTSKKTPLAITTDMETYSETNFGWTIGDWTSDTRTIEAN